MTTQTTLHPSDPYQDGEDLARDAYQELVAIAEEKVAFLMESGGCDGDADKLDQAQRIEDSIDAYGDFWKGVFSRPPNAEGGLYLLSDADKKLLKELFLACMFHMREPLNELPQ